MAEQPLNTDSKATVDVPTSSTISYAQEEVEMQVLNIVQPGLRKPRSKLRLLAVLIALDVSASTLYAPLLVSTLISN